MRTEQRVVQRSALVAMVSGASLFSMPFGGGSGGCSQASDLFATGFEIGYNLVSGGEGGESGYFEDDSFSYGDGW